MKAHKSNLEKETNENDNYRKVIFTGEKMQLVLMSLKPEEDIPLEKHEDKEQFIRVESGTAIVKIDNKDYTLAPGDSIIIPAGSEHHVKNSSDSDDLKLYSIYASPEHPDGTVQKTKAEADAEKDLEESDLELEEEIVDTEEETEKLS